MKGKDVIKANMQAATQPISRLDALRVLKGTAQAKVEGMSPFAKIALALLIVAVVGGAGFTIWYFLIRTDKGKDGESDQAARNQTNGLPSLPGRVLVRNNWRSTNAMGSEDTAGTHCGVMVPYAELAPITATPRPHIITAMSGRGTAHHNYTGKQSIYYDLVPDGFGVFLHNVTLAAATTDALALQIMAFGRGAADSAGDGWMVGQSENSIWTDYEGGNIVGTIPFPAAKFTSAPRVVTSVSCNAHCWTIPGASSVYNITKDNFRLYVPGWTPEGATNSDLRVTFFAWEDGAEFEGAALGSSRTWTAEGDHVVCKISFPTPFAAPPVVVTSLQATSHIWERPDGGSIFNLTKDGFDVRLYGGFTVVDTDTHQVAVNYVAKAAN